MMTKKETLSALALVAISLAGTTPAWAVMSHVMTGGTTIFTDDFTSTYTNNWGTWNSTDPNNAAFTQDLTGGGSVTATRSGSQYAYAEFISKTSVDVSKTTEFVMSENSGTAYLSNRTMFVSGQGPWGTKGLCVTHDMYNGEGKGQISLNLYNNEGLTPLYDSGSMSSYQYEYSFSLIVNSTTGAWSFYCAPGITGVTAADFAASGTLTAEQISTYLSSPLYTLTGVNSSVLTSTVSNTIYGVDIYQNVPEPAVLSLLGLGAGFLLFRRRA
ncbi:MAG: PEP-CTERM sorting domain-containing protein [Lentisphaeria bacterium]